MSFPAILRIGVHYISQRIRISGPYVRGAGGSMAEIGFRRCVRGGSLAGVVDDLQDLLVVVDGIRFVAGPEIEYAAASTVVTACAAQGFAAR